MNRILAFVFIFVFLFVLTPFSVFAAKSKSAASSVAVSAQYIKRANVVRAYFSGLKGVKSVSYMLMYESNGVGQGAMGSVAPGKKTSVSKDMYLGTCSGKVCVAHGNIKNIQLEVTTKYTSGKSSTKTIKVK